MAEWLKAHAWKACKRETVSRVRIPLSPPFKQDNALTREISLVANLDYEKKITDNGKFTAGISAKNTNQNVGSLNVNFGFKLNF